MAVVEMGSESSVLDSFRFISFGDPSYPPPSKQWNETPKAQPVILCSCARPERLHNPIQSFVLPPLTPSLSILLRILPRHPIKLLPILPIRIRRTALHRIIRNRLDQQILRRRQHAQNPRRGFPGLGFENADAHGAVLVEGYVGVPDAGLEGDFGGFEGVVCWEG
jgi:hypothetical protein